MIFSGVDDLSFCQQTLSEGSINNQPSGWAQKYSLYKPTPKFVTLKPVVLLSYYIEKQATSFRSWSSQHIVH